MDADVYSTEIKSFTHNKTNHVIVSKKYLNGGDHILIIDDFLANGCAVEGLMDLVDKLAGLSKGLVSVLKKDSKEAVMPCGKKASISRALLSLKKWMPRREPLCSADEGGC